MQLKARATSPSSPFPTGIGWLRSPPAIRLVACSSRRAGRPTQRRATTITTPDAARARPRLSAIISSAERASASPICWNGTSITSSPSVGIEAGWWWQAREHAGSFRIGITAVATSRRSSVTTKELGSRADSWQPRQGPEPSLTGAPTRSRVAWRMTPR